MPNKRISELTSITGANLADADLLVVVDVSDPTMAASGTNKKITMAELAKDSALTDNLVAKSTLTTDGDILTRAAGEPARITRADLAADSAFSSRYAPVANDTISIPVGGLVLLSGTPAIGSPVATGVTHRAWLLDADATEGLSTNLAIPPWWNTFHVDVLWTNAGAGSGNIVWYSDIQIAGDGDTINTATSTFGPTATAPARGVLRVQRFYTGLSGGTAKTAFLTIYRIATNAADTLTNDIGVYGVTLTRAS